MLFVLPAPRADSQVTSETVEREARTAFRERKFRDAAARYQDAAAKTTDQARRARLLVQAAWAHFNDHNAAAVKDALHTAFAADLKVEILEDFTSAEFVARAEEERRTLRPIPTAPLPDLAELKRSAAEKLQDNRADEVIYDFKKVPRAHLDAEAIELWARAYETAGRRDLAEDLRRPTRSSVVATTLTPTPGPAAKPTATPGPSVGGATAATAGSTPLTAIPTAPPRLNAADEILTAGRAALEAGNIQAAQTAANRAIEADANSSEGYRLLADVYLTTGDKSLAEANWKKSLRLDEKNERTLVTLSDYYRREGNWEESLTHLAVAASLSAKNGESLIRLGRETRQKGNLPVARKIFKIATETYPKSASLATEYASILLALKDTDAALAPLMAAVAAAPNEPEVRVNLAAGLRRAGQMKNAEREYREALRLAPDSVDIRNRLGTLLLETNQPREAAGLFRESLEKSPTKEQRVAVLLGLARALRTQGDVDGAAGTLSTQVTEELTSAELWNEAGVIAHERRQFRDALIYFERAVARSSDFAVARKNRDRAREIVKFLDTTAVNLPAS